MKISPEMRAAIDGAVAEGRVTRVPSGETTEPEPAKNRASSVPLRNDAAIASKEERQKRVQELFDQGKTIKEMAAICGVSHQTIITDKKALGLIGSNPAPKRAAPSVAAKAVDVPASVSVLRYVSRGELDRMKDKISRQLDELLAIAAQVDKELERRAK